MNGSLLAFAGLLLVSTAGLSAVFELADIEGATGVLINGGKDATGIGEQVAAAGDMNGDGLEDLLVMESFSHRAYLFYGTPEILDRPISVEDFDESRGVIFHGDARIRSVGGGGDVNGDGFDDLVFGMSLAVVDGRFAGAASVVYGGAELPAEVVLRELDGTDGFRLNGEFGNDRTGGGVAIGGDFNDDGFDDIVVTASGFDGGGEASGRAYVFFGRKEIPVSQPLADLDGTDGFIFQGTNQLDGVGDEIAWVGDVNLDGFEDVVVGGYGSRNTGYLLFGSDRTQPAEIHTGDLDGVVGSTLTATSSAFGVSGGGDLNGDGHADFVVGTPWASTDEPSSGRVYVVFGTSEPFPPLLDLTMLDGQRGFQTGGIAASSCAGWSVSMPAGGDVNGDGLDDLLIGAPFAFSNVDDSGGAFVVLGRTEPFADRFSLSELAPDEMLEVRGAQDASETGFSVLTLDDFNGDGVDDFVIGAAEFDDTNECCEGRVYIVFGRSELGP